ncbi:GNAT family N-acetyltransferase [bacterium]|nr:GNAT family N-acetyltransferase [bacterium]
MEIRKYQVTDKQNLQKICIITANPQKNEQGEKLLTLLYNDYYTEQEPDSCFVLTDDNDNAVGYIICAKNFDEYKKVFSKVYLPQVKKLSLVQYLIKKLSFIIEKKLSKNYPAHLHIDILPDFTGKGSGSMLINALCAYLSEQKIKGVMLCVGSHNVRAISFYKKHGFVKIINLGGVFMGKKL